MESTTNNKQEYTKEEKEESTKKKNKKVYKEFIWTLTSAIAIALLIRAFIVEAYEIPTGSMESTLLVGDHLFANKFIYGVKIPIINYKIIPISNVKRGDIFLFKAPPEPKKNYIKRCIGIPGDVIEMKDRVLYVNGKVVNELYVQYTDTTIRPAPDPRDNFGPIKIPEDSYFAMGDNRDNSNDSRYWGFVPDKNVIGKALILYWPLNRFRFIR